MSKKNFTGGLSSLLGDQPEKPKLGRPVTQIKEVIKSSQQGTKEKETRATFIVNENTLDRVKSVAYWDRLKIKDVLHTALEEYLSKYEKTKGSIKPLPEK